MYSQSHLDHEHACTRECGVSRQLLTSLQTVSLGPAVTAAVATGNDLFGAKIRSSAPANRTVLEANLP